MTSAIYDFIWGDFCDWYLELTKSRIYGKSSDKSKEVALQNLVVILKSALNLLHPFMPFITEEIQSIFSIKDLTTGVWIDKFVIHNRDDVEKIEIVTEIVIRIRALRAGLNITPDKKCKVIVQSTDKMLEQIIEEGKNSIIQLSRAESLEINNSIEISKSDSVTPFSKGKIILPMAGMIDFEKEKDRLKKEQDSLHFDMDKIRKKIDNPDFISKAKPEIIQKEKEKFNLLKEKLETIMLSMEKFS